MATVVPEIHLVLQGMLSLQGLHLDQLLVCDVGWRLGAGLGRAADMLVADIRQRRLHCLQRREGLKFATHLHVLHGCRGD